MLWRPRVMVGGGWSVAAGTSPPVLAAHATSWTPGTADIANANPITVGARFTVSAPTVARGLALFPATTIAGTYTIAFWQTTSDDDPGGTGTGTLLTSKSIAAATLAAGWNYPTLPYTFSVGVVYTAGYWTSGGHFPRTADAFNGAAVTGHGVTLLAAGTDPNPPLLGAMTNGVFHDDTGSAGLAYPNVSFGFADYGVDLWL